MSEIPTIVLPNWDRALTGFLVDWKILMLPMITVYRHPKDRPDKYVARLFDMDKPTPFVVIADTEAEIVASIPPQFVRIERQPEDDANIVCVYV